MFKLRQVLALVGVLLLVCASAGPALALGVEGPNLLTNGDCELDLPKLNGNYAVTATTPVLSTAAFHGGTKSLEVTSTSTAVGYYTVGLGNLAGLQGLVVGKTYLFRYWMFLPSASHQYHFQSESFVSGYSSTNFVFLVYALTNYPDALNAWYQKTVIWTVTPGVQQLYFQFKDTSTTVGRKLYVDDIELRELTEPTPAPVVTPSPCPVCSAEPCAPVTPSSAPSSDPLASPTPTPVPGSTHTPGGILPGFGVTMATDYMLLADKVANITIGIVFLLLVIRRLGRFF